LRRFALVVLVTAATALVAALPAAGKGRVAATLLTKIPLDAPAGTRLEVAWRLTYFENGRRRAFGAGDVFIRLRSAAGRSTADEFANGDGVYRATLVVPKGGIEDVQIGLQGWTNGPGGTRESDLLFPITNDPLPGAAPSDRSWPSWIVVLVAAPLALLAVLVVYQRRPVRKARLRVQPSSKPQSR
jgi:hypothetical protein